MKIYICVLVFAVLPFLAIGQKKGLYITPAISFAALPNTKNSFEDQFFHVTVGRYVAATANVGYMFNEHIGIASGLGVDRYEFDLKDKSLMYSGALRFDNTYVAVPIYTRFTTGKQSTLGFYGNLGFRFSVAANAKATTYLDNTKQNVQSLTSDMTKVLFAPYFSTGLRIPLGSRVGIDAGAEWQAHIMDMYNKGSGAEYYAFPIGLRIALNVKLTK